MRRGRLKIKLLIGACIILFALFRYYSNSEVNEFTGKKQHISLSADDEIAIGLHSVPQMAQQHGGLYPDQNYQKLVDQVGQKLVSNIITQQTPYTYDFHLLKDPQTINAFALPGGQIFITYALYSQLENDDQLAGVLGHEIGHVLGRHSSERIAESDFWQTISQGANVGANAGDLVAGIGQNTLLTNGRGDELESDDLGIKFMIDAGYDPYEMIDVMEILKAAGGSNRVPEFQSTHPDPDNRIDKIKASIKKYGR
jgi:predicted Zn-dependent protease